jgi:hypothetical protein
MFGDILLALVLAAIAAAVVVPFVIGFVRGPQPALAHPGQAGLAEPMRPLTWTAGVYGRFLIVYLVASSYFLSRGFDGGGPHGSVCVDTGYPYDGVARGFAARSGASLRAGGDVTACALHPSAGQWGLYLMTRLPEVVLWGCLLLLIWRLIAEAGRSGPFTPRAARAVRQLGWAVIAGSIIAAALDHLGADLMTRMLMTPATYDGKGIIVDVLLFGPLKALVPVPALAGAALLTFGRITKAGAVMDEELKAMV